MKQLSLKKVSWYANNQLFSKVNGDVTLIGGIAAPFNVVTDTDHQPPTMILSNAFDDILQGENEVRLFTDHSYTVENLIATRSSGSLKLIKDDTSLNYEATLPPLNDKLNHLVTMAKQGALGASVGGYADEYDIQDGVRVISKMQLDEISITPMPAFSGASAEVFSIQKDNDVWIKAFQARQEATKKRYYFKY